MIGDSNGDFAKRPSKGTSTRTAVLIVEQDLRVIEGLRQLLRISGVDVIDVQNGAEAHSLCGIRPITVAVIDVDTPRAGLELLQLFRQRSPATEVIVLCSEASFELALEAWRRGAADLVVKDASNVPYLVERVMNFCRGSERREANRKLLAEVLQIHEKFLQRMLDVTQRFAASESVHNPDSRVPKTGTCSILVVDDDPQTARGLQGALGSSQMYRVHSIESAGEALEILGEQQFQIALIKSSLTELGAETLAGALESEQEDCLILLFALPEGPNPGQVDLFKRGHRTLLIKDLSESGQLINLIYKLRAKSETQSDESRYVQLFRSEHEDFLRSYVKLRRKLVQAIEVEAAADAGML